MKKILLTLLAVIVIIGALAGVGYWGYRIGYNDGATGSESGPFFGRSYHMNPAQMPFHRYDEGFNRGFGFNQHSMMKPGGFNTMGYGYFSPFLLLLRVAVVGLIIWLAYWLFTRSGWQITRKMDAGLKSDSAE